MQSNRKRDRFIIKSDTKCDSDISISLLTCRHLDRFLRFRRNRWKQLADGHRGKSICPIGSISNPEISPWNSFRFPHRIRRIFFCRPERRQNRFFLLGDNVKSSTHSFRGKMRRISSQTKGPPPQERKKKNSNPSAGSDRKSAGSNHHNNRYVRHSAQQKETSCRLVLLRPFHCSVTASQGCEMGMQRWIVGRTHASRKANEYAVPAAEK